MLRRMLCTNMRTHEMNIEVYLDRINYRGSLIPNLNTLRNLVWSHKTTVPYSTIEYVNHDAIKLDVKEMYEKIVTNKCGGLCFELNGLFGWLLQRLGFDVTQYIAAFYIGKNQLNFFYLF